MALTDLQRRICRLIAANRISSGESYVAGGAALNELLDTSRISSDVDIFHDTEEALQVSWAADRALLEAEGFRVRVTRERAGIVEAEVGDDEDRVRLEWAPVGRDRRSWPPAWRMVASGSIGALSGAPCPGSSGVRLPSTRSCHSTSGGHSRRVAGTMTIDRLRRFFDAWNEHDVELIVSFFTPDGAYYASIGPDDEGTAFRGTDEVRRGVAAFLGTYGDVHYTDLVIGMDGDRGFASWTFHASRPDGEQVTYRGVDLFTFEGDLIALKDAYRKERSRPIGG